MSNPLILQTQAQKIQQVQQFDNESKINIETISNCDEKDQIDALKQNFQTNNFEEELPLEPAEKKINSEKKIPHVFSQLKSMVDRPLKKQIGRYKQLINVSQKKLAQSLKRMTLGRQTQKQSKKIKSFQMPFSFISQSVDLVKLKSEEQRNFVSPKMPDLLKIKLKKELQSIQKNQKPKKPHFMRNHNKNHLKRQSTPLVFLDCQFEKFEEQNRHEKAKQKSKRSVINQRKFSNFKKVQKMERKEKISITISHLKDTLDFKQWQKRTTTEETTDGKNLGKHRNHIKYSRLLEYAKKPKQNSQGVGSEKRNNRIKTESALYNSLIAADVNILELQGTKITDQFFKGDRSGQFNMMTIKSKLKNGRTTPVEPRPKINMFHKLINSQSGTKPTKESKHFQIKNIEISPWANSNRQCQNELD